VVNRENNGRVYGSTENRTGTAWVSLNYSKRLKR
jgi:hypothetical protein